MVRASGSMRGPSSRRYFVHPPVSASVTPSWAAKESNNSNGQYGQNGQNQVGQPGQPHYHHRPMCIDLDNTVAINGNVCLCEGLENSHNGGRLCRRCGLERQAVKAKVESWWKDWISTDPSSTKAGKTTSASASKNNNDLLMIKRSQSEESVSTNTNNPYEAMRKQRLSASTNMQGRYVSGWGGNNLDDDEDSDLDEPEPELEAEGLEIDEEGQARAYAEVDMIYNSVRRRGPAPPAMFQPSYVMHAHATTVADQHQQPPSRLQRSSSSVIRRSIILKTPTSMTGKRLPTPPRGTPTSSTLQSKSKSTASVYVAPTEPQPNNTVVKINMDSESSAKESSSEVEDEINGMYTMTISRNNPGGILE